MSLLQRNPAGQTAEYSGGALARVDALGLLNRGSEIWQGWPAELRKRISGWLANVLFKELMKGDQRMVGASSASWMPLSVADVFDGAGEGVLLASGELDCCEALPCTAMHASSSAARTRRQRHLWCPAL